MPCVDPIPELKREAAAAIVALLDGWSWQQAAALIGSDQPRVSDLRRGKLDRFSLETLIRFLARLRQRVELHITTERIARAARKTPSR